MPQLDQATVRNRLLAALPSDTFTQLAGTLQPVSLKDKQVLHAPGEPVEAAYFPESGTVSMLAPLEGGELLEVGMIGREGMVGLPVILGTDSLATEAMTQMPGTAWRIRASALREAFEHSAALRALLLRYVQAYHTQVALAAACNARHAIEERLARWLLMAHDRAEGDELPLTQEFIAQMLGVRRAGVTVAAGSLQRAGLIRHRNGHITVLDRPGLEAEACECYGTVRQQFEHILGGWGDGAATHA